MEWFFEGFRLCRRLYAFEVRLIEVFIEICIVIAFQKILLHGTGLKVKFQHLEQILK